jgi:hypothetical protein
VPKIGSSASVTPICCALEDIVGSLELGQQKHFLLLVIFGFLVTFGFLKISI